MRHLLIATTMVLGWLLASIQPSFAIKQFIVFFGAGDATRLDPEQWRVTPEGDTVIAEAASVTLRYGGFILLIGGDHKVGTAEDAIERSRRRAEAVKDVLVARGVPAESIETRACGYTRPLVETARGVKEPQNRFVLFSIEATKADLERQAAIACVPYVLR